MANLIDYTYFTKGQVAISNVASTSAAGVAVKDSVTNYITDYEAELLRLLFGADLYDEYVAAPTAARWTGVKTLLYDSTNKLSLIADYVWFKYQQDHQIISTQGGDKQTGDANMIAAVNAQKMVNVWNKMVDKIELLYDYMKDNSADFDTWDGGYDFEKINIMNI